MICPYDHAAMDTANALSGPTAAHWFGTDIFGRDVLSRVLYGARISIAVSLLSVLVAAASSPATQVRRSTVCSP